MIDPEPNGQPVESTSPPEKFPFWTYSDLLLFIGFAFVSLLTGAFIVRATTAIFRLHVHRRILEILPAQFLGYLILFLLLWLLFRIQYGRPFWNSMRWVTTNQSVPSIAALGVLLAFGVGLTSVLLRTPNINSPMREMLSDPTSVVIIAIFGTTLGPLCEELIFRGFMQPLFVRSLGALPGVILAAVPFGLLHLPEYGNSWRHGLLIMLAGVAFGWVRHKTGSTRASTIMHAAYNCTFFLALLAERRNLPHTW